MLVPALAFLAGHLWSWFIPNLPLALLSAGVAMLFRRGRTLAIWFAAGVLAQAFWGQAGLPQPLPAALEGQDILVQGRVASVPERRGPRLRFLFETDAVQDGGGWQPMALRLRLGWYGAPRSLRAGARWQLRVRLKRPHGFANPGGFYYEAWLVRQGIQATGYVRRSADNRRLARAPGWRLAALRQRLAEGIRRHLDGHPQLGVILALTLGIKSGIDDAQWRRFRSTGTGHLMAISGLHVGMVAGCCFFLGHWLWSRSVRLSSRLAAPRAGGLAAVAGAALYAGLAGFSIPTQRALIMVAAAALALLAARHTRPMDVLGIALIGVLVLEPPAVGSPGFWLSFGAVFLILWHLGGRAPPRGFRARAVAALRVALVVGIGLIPVTFAAFQQAAWLGPLVNIFAVPWVTLLVVPAALAGLLALPWLPGVAGALLGFAGDGFGLLDAALGWLAALPGADWRLPPPGPVALGTALVGVLWMTASRPVPGRRLVAPGLLLPLFLARPPAPLPGTAEVALLDVGQGLAAVVRTRHHTLVYDTGPRFRSGFETGSAVVLPYLIQAGVDAVDVLLVSHGDNDHIGGARGLAEGLPVYRVVTSVPEAFDWRYVRRCNATMAWDWDGVRFEILHPRGRRHWSENNASCVLRVTAGEDSVLFTGDIEAPAERALVRSGIQLAARVLVAPHHGSRTSSTGPFIDAVAPEYVLFPAGYRNRFRFPRPEVVARYRERGIRPLVTGETGAIEFRLGGEEERWVPRTFRVPDGDVD